MKIGYTTSYGTGPLESCSDLITPEPERLSSDYMIEQCPASTHFIKNHFLIRSPIDLEIHWDGINRYASAPNLTQEQFDTLILVRENQYRESDRSTFIGFNFNYLFVADEPCDVAQYPAFYHGSPFEVAMGSFPIHKWQRPLQFNFRMKHGDVFKIKRGDPLFYVHFRPHDLSICKLVELEANDPVLQNNLHRCLSVKLFQKNLSWKLIKGEGNHLRPKRFIPRQCPFKAIKKWFK